MPETVDLMAALDRSVSQAKALHADAQTRSPATPSYDAAGFQPKRLSTEDAARERRYWGLGTPSRVVLQSLATDGPYSPRVSDLVYLLALVRDGLATRVEEGVYDITPEGWAVYQAAHG